jgi:hypothetical protein
LHFDVVLVSGTNQYKVKPLESVSTIVPPIVLEFTVFEAVPDWVLVLVPPDVAGVVVLLALPHPAAINAAAASPAGTSHLLFIAVLRSLTGFAPPR